MAANMENNSKAPYGVYKNVRLMHVCTNIVGSVVHLETKDGPIWEGIFNTFSPEFTICLDLAVQIDPKINSKDCLYAALKSGSEAKEKAFFDLKDIVRITVTDVDLNYATKDSEKLTTDNDISGFDPNKLGKNRELEFWQDYDGDDPNNDSLLSLDEVAAAERKNNSSIHNNSRGWDAQEMFKYNETVHKVSSTYDDKLGNYTIQLESKSNSKEWRKKQERAAAIAKEIETNTKSQNRLAKEDGSDCEEEKFSAVVRPQNTSPPPAQVQSQQPTQQQTHHQQQPQQIQPQPPPHHHQPQPQHQQHHQHHQQQHHQQHPQQHQPMQHHQQQQQQRPVTNRLNPGNQNGTHKNFRPRFTDRSRIDSLKNFGKQLTLAPSPRQPLSPATGINQQQSPHQQSQLKPNKPLPHMHTPPHQQSNQQSHQPNQQPPQPPRVIAQQDGHVPMQQPQAPQPPQSSQPTHQQTQHHQHPQHQHGSQQPPNHHHHQHPPPQHPQQHQQQPTIITSQSNQQSQTPPQTLQIPTTTATASQPTSTPTSTTDTSATLERSDTNSSLGSSQTKDPSEIARNSTLNPDAKEFVYKPRSPASVHGAQQNGPNPALVGQAVVDPANSSPMSQASHGPYYQQVPIFPHGLSPHQQHHPAHFMPNHTHLQFPNQIHYMPSPVAPHFAAQQMSPRYIRSNLQNYHHRNGDHNNVRAAYSQASMIAPTSTGQQPYVPSPSGAPHPMNAYPGSPQQPMIYSGPPQSMYPMVQAASFPQHMPQHMPNPPYDGSAVYMPQQNYIVNPQQ